jgi:uncharacterized UBP type Zn finger protein
VGSGHYVCYIRKDNEWIYYNDEKVFLIFYDILYPNNFFFFNYIKRYQELQNHY